MTSTDMTPRVFCLIAVLVALAGVCAAVFVPVYAADPLLFQRGQTYTVVWDCTPEWMSQYMSQMAAGGQPLNPCYIETLTVQQVRSDGWVVVKDEGGNAWTVNQTRMIGFAPRAAAPLAASQRAF